MPGVTSDCMRPGRMKRLAARAHDDPETAKQHALKRMEAINAKSFRRFRSRQRQAPNYAAAVADFTETEDCSPLDAVALNPCCIELAREFDKTPEEVAGDITCAYIASYSR